MKRILILCGALALPAAVGLSSLNEAEHLGAFPGLSRPQDTAVVVRRVYEGPLTDFWANGPSPDGRYVTQTDWDTGDLAVLDLLTGQMRRVTDKGDNGFATSFAYSEAARFSPDGQQIAYAWYTEPGTYELRVINVDGTGSHLVARAGFNAEDRPPSYVHLYEWWPLLHGWSPDGQHILATLYYGQKRQELTLLSVSDGSREILQERKGVDAAAAFSPDGRHLAYGEEHDIFVRPVPSGDAVRVTSGPSTDLVVGWTADGSLLYSSDRDLTEGVWRVPMRDGSPAGDAELVAGDLWGMEPMGVAGNRMVYGIQTQAPRLQVVSLDLKRNRVSGTPTPVEPQMRESSFPSWSPDGQKLAYFVGRGDRARLTLLSTAGGEPRDVTPASLSLERDPLRWSEDGRQILISGEERESGRKGVFAYTIATGEVEQVFSDDELEGLDIAWETFSSDWGTVYLGVWQGSAYGPQALLRRDLATKDQRTLLTRPGLSEGGVAIRIRRMHLSPDDRSLAFWEFTAPDTARMLRVMSTDGGNPRTLLTVPWSDESGHPGCVGIHIPLWTKDGRHLLTILPDSVPEGAPLPPNPCKLYKVPVEGGDPIFVGALPEHGMWALSPDGGRLAFSTGEYRGEFWILQGLERR